MQKFSLTVYVLNNFRAADKVVELIGVFQISFGNDVLYRNIFVIYSLGQAILVNVEVCLCKFNTFWSWIDASD